MTDEKATVGLLWTDARIDAAVRRMDFPLLIQSQLAEQPLFAMRDQYEAERAQLLARIAQLEHYTQRLEATLADNDDVFTSYREIEAALNARIAELEAPPKPPSCGYATWHLLDVDILDPDWEEKFKAKHAPTITQGEAE